MNFWDIVVLGVASASAWMLVARDTLTRPIRHKLIRRVYRSGSQRFNQRTDPWESYHPSRNRLTWWVEYVHGCSLCAPTWFAAVFYATSKLGPSWLNEGSWAVQAVLAARLVGWCVLRGLNEEGVRDWPESGYRWPAPHPRLARQDREVGGGTP
jgi:hypothetical protein